ncbi:MAG: hypothetical protein AAGD10_17825, partial [Myxococcota bacterium]
MMKRLVILAGFLAACGETSSNGPGTGGTPDAGGVPDVCGSPADPLNNDVCRLVAGTPSSEVISPVGDVDRFSFDASEGEII